jgi:hypothetical protein
MLVGVLPNSLIRKESFIQDEPNKHQKKPEGTYLSRDKKLTLLKLFSLT